MFALVDCNNFYASCERVFRPDLNAQPVVVLSNNDGCVIARSAEAKAAEIPMGAPAFQWEQTFKKKGVQVFSSNCALYGDMSASICAVFRSRKAAMVCCVSVVVDIPSSLCRLIRLLGMVWHIRNGVFQLARLAERADKGVQQVLLTSAY